MAKFKHRKPKTKDHNQTPLEHHTREGKMLHPPFKKIKGIQFTSWANSRLPDQIWIALLMTHLDRTLAIDAFRQVAIASQAPSFPATILISP